MTPKVIRERKLKSKAALTSYRTSYRCSRHKQPLPSGAELGTLSGAILEPHRVRFRATRRQSTSQNKPCTSSGLESSSILYGQQGCEQSSAKNGRSGNRGKRPFKRCNIMQHSARPKFHYLDRFDSWSTRLSQSSRSLGWVFSGVPHGPGCLRRCQISETTYSWNLFHSLALCERSAALDCAILSDSREVESKTLSGRR
jgi:hypothetical protein